MKALLARKTQTSYSGQTQIDFRETQTRFFLEEETEESGGRTESKRQLC